MSNKITDRELLAFCSLAKLKLEFSQYKKWSEEEQRIIYKTPRKLIQEEIEGQKERERLGLITKKKELIDMKFELDSRRADPNYIKNQIVSKYGPFTEDDYELWKIYDDKKGKYDEEVIRRIRKGENIGVFYNVHDNSEVDFMYEESTILRKTSPIFMEYYDKQDENPENKFLDEWEIMYTGDAYEITTTLIKDFIEQIILPGKTDTQKQEKQI